MQDRRGKVPSFKYIDESVTKIKDILTDRINQHNNAYD